MSVDLFSLEGKVAIVTGACGLLGVQHCEALAAAGAMVVAADLDEAAAMAVAGRLDGGRRHGASRDGASHLGVGLDVTSVASLESARRRILDNHGRIDVLVNNAAINDMFVSRSAIDVRALSPGALGSKLEGECEWGLSLFAGIGWRDGGAGQWEHY